MKIDHGDDVYTNQKIFIDCDAAFHLVELLNDESTAVSVRAATLIALITDHSAAAKVRLQSGALIGLENHVGRILLNPIQGDFIEAGAIEKLVPWLVGPSTASQRSDAALSALTNMTNYNMDGKIVYLSALISTFSTHTAAETTPRVVDALESVLDHIDCTHADVVPLLNKLIHPLETALAVGGSLSALSLIATLCENTAMAVPDLTARLRAETSIVQSVAKYLIHGGSFQVQDTAARALWFLTVGDVAGVLDGGGGLLGDQVGALVDVLRSLVERSVQDEAAQVARDEEMHQQRRREQQRHQGSEVEEENEHMASFNINRRNGKEEENENEEEVCFAEEAKKLLEAVAKVNPHLEIKTTLMGEENVQGSNSSCIVM